MTNQEKPNYNLTFMHNLNVAKTNVIVTLLKICCCNKNIETYIIQTYYKKPCLNVVTFYVIGGNLK